MAQRGVLPSSVRAWKWQRERRMIWLAMPIFVYRMGNATTNQPRKTLRTLRFEVDPEQLDSAASRDAICRAAEILRAGGTVAFPTETVYGLGANALDAAAVGRIFEAKRRPAWDPLIVHIADRTQLAGVVQTLPGNAEALIGRFWPGPLTLLMPRHSRVPAAVSAGLPKVGVRMPSHPVAHRLLKVAGVPVAAPSANLFRRTSPTRAAFVLEDLDGRIDAVLDGGETTLGLESTVLDICENPPVLYRPGMIPREELEKILGPIVVYRPEQGAEPAPGAAANRLPRPAPGVGMKHYAPRARLVLIDLRDVTDIVRALEQHGETVGLMEPQGYLDRPAPPVKAVYRWGNWSDVNELARRLYAGLRRLDRAEVSVILCPLPESGGVGTAIRDRLTKAARRDETGE